MWTPVRCNEYVFSSFLYMYIVPKLCAFCFTQITFKLFIIHRWRQEGCGTSSFEVVEHEEIVPATCEGFGWTERWRIVELWVCQIQVWSPSSVHACNHNSNIQSFCHFKGIFILFIYIPISRYNLLRAIYWIMKISP